MILLIKLFPKRLQQPVIKEERPAAAIPVSDQELRNGICHTVGIQLRKACLFHPVVQLLLPKAQIQAKPQKLLSGLRLIVSLLQLFRRFFRYPQRPGNLGHTHLLKRLSLSVLRPLPGGLHINQNRRSVIPGLQQGLRHHSSGRILILVPFCQLQHPFRLHAIQKPIAGDKKDISILQDNLLPGLFRLSGSPPTSGRLMAISDLPAFHNLTAPVRLLAPNAPLAAACLLAAGGFLTVGCLLAFIRLFADVILLPAAQRPSFAVPEQINQLFSRVKSLRAAVRPDEKAAYRIPAGGPPVADAPFGLVPDPLQSNSPLPAPGPGPQTSAHLPGFPRSPAVHAFAVCHSQKQTFFS